MRARSAACLCPVESESVDTERKVLRVDETEHQAAGARVGNLGNRGLAECAVRAVRRETGVWGGAAEG